eukprot:2005890-Amphidinium_carterae.1
MLQDDALQLIQSSVVLYWACWQLAGLHLKELLRHDHSRGNPHTRTRCGVSETARSDVLAADTHGAWHFRGRVHNCENITACAKSEQQSRCKHIIREITTPWHRCGMLPDLQIVNGLRRWQPHPRSVSPR